MEFLKKDNIFTIQLPESDLVFTRYLYVKEEVRLALLVSILNKSDDAIFWAYELYYSGFKFELLNLIWKIYYDFFASLNPAYEAYLLKKHKEILAGNYHERIISSIISDLLFRPFNSDVFMLRNICENFEIDIDYYNAAQKITSIEEAHFNLSQWIFNNDFRSVAQWILNVNKTFSHIDIYNICLDIFEREEVKIMKNKLTKEFVSAIKININKNHILLAKIMTLFSKKEQLKKGKSIYINVEPEDIIIYESIIGSEHLKPYKILESAYICGIDDFKHLSLFKLTRNKYNLQDKYWNNWEYHASFSPLWFQRIIEFKGYINYNKQNVIFMNDDWMDEFYEFYGLDPDEQKLNIQNKSVQPIEKMYNWKWFNERYKKNGLFEVYEEELEEFDVDGLIY